MKKTSFITIIVLLVITVIGCVYLLVSRIQLKSSIEEATSKYVHAETQQNDIKTMTVEVIKEIDKLKNEYDSHLLIISELNREIADKELVINDLTKADLELDKTISILNDEVTGLQKKIDKLSQSAN